jgi:hypothetical protein
MSRLLYSSFPAVVDFLFKRDVGKKVEVAAQAAAGRVAPEIPPIPPAPEAPPTAPANRSVTIPGAAPKPVRLRLISHFFKTSKPAKKIPSSE